MKAVAALVVALLLTGCLAKTMKSWEGHHKDDLIKKWGPPARETVLSDGGTSMVYFGNATYRSQAGWNHINTEGSMCKMVFNTDKNSVITSWSYYGC